METDKKTDVAAQHTEKEQETDERSQPASPLEVFPDILWLLSQSPFHKHLFIADLEWFLLPPYQLKQFRVIRQGDKPVGFISWAFVSDEVQERLMGGMVKLKPNEWMCGKNAWIISVVAPFGGGDEVVKKVRQQVLGDFAVKTFAPDEHGKMGVVEI